MDWIKKRVAGGHPLNLASSGWEGVSYWIRPSAYRPAGLLKSSVLSQSKNAMVELGPVSKKYSRASRPFGFLQMAGTPGASPDVSKEANSFPMALVTIAR